jgi:hypothetical protein
VAAIGIVIVVLFGKAPNLRDFLCLEECTMFFDAADASEMSPSDPQGNMRETYQ